MADWETNDSGGMDEEQAIKKMIKIVESFNKTMKGGVDLTEKSQVQLMKSILSHQKAYKTDKDHQMWKKQDREVAKRNAIEIFQERQKELRLSKLINKSLKDQKNAYDSVFQSISGSRGLTQSLKMMTNRFTEIKDTISRISKIDKERSETPQIDQKAHAELMKNREIWQDMLNRLTFNNSRLKSMGDKLVKLGDFMEKHAGKLIIGAAAISILTGIITKALNVAPLFQAMMKLMQFAVTMVLMPIGTFFGAVIKPMVIGLVRNLAPQFGAWMDNAMKIGNALGMFLVGMGESIDVTFFSNIKDAMSNLAKWTGNPFEDLTPEQEGGLVAGGLIGGTAIVAAAASKIIPRLPVVGNFFGANNAKGGSSSTTYSTSSSGGGSSFKDPPTGKKQGGILAYLKELLQKVTKGRAMKGGLAVGGAMLLMEMFLPMNDIVANINRTFRDATGQNNNHNQLFASGYNLAGEGIGERDMNWKANGQTTPFSGNTPNIDEVNALMASINAPAKWMQDQPTMDKLAELLAGGDVKDIGQSMDSAGDMAAKFEEVATIMGTENAPVIDHQMSLIMNYFINMKKMGRTSNEAAIETAGNFVHANQAIKDALASWVNRVKTSETASGSDKQKARNAQSAYLAGVGDQGHTGFGGNGFSWNKKEPVNPLKRVSDSALAKAAQQAIEKYNRDNAGVNSGTYEDLYNGIPTQGDTYYSTQRSEKALEALNKKHGKTRAQMENSLTPIGSLYELTGGLIGTKNYASGGWINEPVKGIGMNSGQSYSIGERGAEFVSPNGGGSGGGITINIAKIERTADFNQLKPMIQRWILEANSRRGMI